MTIQDAFGRTVEYYDEWIKVAVPGYPEIFELAVRGLPFAREDSISLLDLGAGTGLFTWHVLQRYPLAECVLVDLAPEMLEVARNRFRDVRNVSEYLILDYREGELPGGMDLVISSLSIHHLPHDGKRALFRRIAALLKPGGMFLNIDQIKAPTEALAELYWNEWIAGVREAGGSERQLEESIERRRRFDIDATLGDQLAWMEEAGFAEVDLLYKLGFVGLFRARTAG